MKLIAEAGATKIHWGIIDFILIQEFDSEGFNPNVSAEQELSKVIVAALPGNLNPSMVDEIYYYGAGCATTVNKDKVAHQLKFNFPDAGIIVVKSDLEAAAVALFEKKPGIVAILGTGANAGFYNGHSVENNILSLGYLMGDEGSGAYLGFQLLKRYLRKELLKPVQSKLATHISMPDIELVRHIYKQSNISRYFAGFVPFIAENISDECIAKMVDEALDLFIRFHLEDLIKQFPNHRVGIAGGVANLFRYQLTEKLRTMINDEIVIIERPFNQLIQQFIIR